MCGILGLFASSVSRTDLERGSQLLVHRGPDDAGVYLGDGIGLATRRLSIVDLEGGAQPLSNEDGSIWITYNGEVYNAPDLRVKLETAGHRFRTQTDTEVIVHAYEEWGVEAVSRLRGMFAFGLWDAERCRLLLARDRFGIKPLYYAEVGGRFAFASAIRPLLQLLPALPREADREALCDLFAVGFIPAPLTAFAGVQELPAAHTLILEEQARRLERYWTLTGSPEERREMSQEEATEAFRARVREVVNAWRMSDVPVGALLSGGVDSASLAALLTEVSDGPLHTFTIGFVAGSHDEAARARETARALGSHHHELTFSTAAFDCLPAVVQHLEEPQRSATAIPLYLLYKACHEAGFKVVMTGEGADELLGGYYWFDGDRRVRPFLRLPGVVRRLLARLPLPTSAAGRRVLAQGTRDPVSRYALWQQTSRPAQRTALLRMSHTSIAECWQTQYDGALQGRHPLDQFQLLEAQTRMTDFINFEVDRMSMAHSVEARPPFLDHTLWEFCAGLPPEYKLSSRGNKLLLRHALRGMVPASVRRRPKKGLATPHAD